MVDAGLVGEEVPGRPHAQEGRGIGDGLDPKPPRGVLQASGRRARLVGEKHVALSRPRLVGGWFPERRTPPGACPPTGHSRGPPSPYPPPPAATSRTHTAVTT